MHATMAGWPEFVGWLRFVRRVFGLAGAGATGAQQGKGGVRRIRLGGGWGRRIHDDRCLVL